MTFPLEVFQFQDILLSSSGLAMTSSAQLSLVTAQTPSAPSLWLLCCWKISPWGIICHHGSWKGSSPGDRQALAQGCRLCLTIVQAVHMVGRSRGPPFNWLLNPGSTPAQAASCRPCCHHSSRSSHMPPLPWGQHCPVWLPHPGAKCHSVLTYMTCGRSGALGRRGTPPGSGKERHWGLPPAHGRGLAAAPELTESVPVSTYADFSSRYPSCPTSSFHRSSCPAATRACSGKKIVSPVRSEPIFPRSPWQVPKHQQQAPPARAHPTPPSPPESEPNILSSGPLKGSLGGTNLPV